MNQPNPETVPNQGDEVDTSPGHQIKDSFTEIKSDSPRGDGSVESAPTRTPEEHEPVREDPPVHMDLDL